MSQLYHLGPYPFFQAPLMVSGASQVHALSQDGALSLVTIGQGNAVELGKITSPDELEDGDAVSAKLDVVIRGASHLVDSIGSAATRHNALSLEISGDREVRLSRAERVLTPEEEQQALDANDRNARAIVERAETVDNLEQFLQERVERYLEANMVSMGGKGEMPPRPELGPIRITDDLAMSVRSTGDALSSVDIMIFGAREALTAYRNRSGGSKVTDAEREVLHRKAALGELSRLGDFAFRLDREAFERTRKKRISNLKIKNQVGYGDLVARLQAEWSLSPFVADALLEAMVHVPLDPDSRKDMELLLPISPERGAALMAAYDVRHQMAPSVFRYTRPDGSVADHPNFGLRSDPFSMQAATAIFFNSSRLFRDVPYLLGPAFSERVSYWSVRQRDFFTPGDAASNQENWFLPTSVQSFLENVRPARPEGAVTPRIGGPDIQLVQPGQKISKRSNSGKMEVELEVEPVSEGSESKLIAHVTIDQQISRHMVRKYSIDEDDFDYEGVPKAAFMLDGQLIPYTQIELDDTGDARDPGFLKMYCKVELLAGHSHKLVIAGPDIRAKKSEKIELQIKVPAATNES